jgi:hypothetical protein
LARRRLRARPPVALRPRRSARWLRSADFGRHLIGSVSRQFPLKAPVASFCRFWPDASMASFCQISSEEPHPARWLRSARIGRWPGGRVRPGQSRGKARPWPHRARRSLGRGARMPATRSAPGGKTGGSTPESAGLGFLPLRVRVDFMRASLALGGPDCQCLFLFRSQGRTSAFGNLRLPPPSLPPKRPKCAMLKSPQGIAPERTEAGSRASEGPRSRFRSGRRCTILRQALQLGLTPAAKLGKTTPESPPRLPTTPGI